ncbi:MAG: hypothetical protein V1934_03865 [Methanobacteriota archaeon]
MGIWNQDVTTDWRYDGDTSGGWNPEDQSDNSGFAPLDEDLTWDIKVQIEDDSPVTNYARAYDEFGFFKYTYLGNAGIVNGGSVYGSGAPNTNDVALSPSNVNITFRANCPYRLGVQLMGDLNGLAVPANTIDGDAVSIQGGDAARTYFAAGGSTIYLIGPALNQDPLGSGRFTTTSTYDSDPDWDPVFWWCDIPGVPEDQYSDSLTYSLSS